MKQLFTIFRFEFDNYVKSKAYLWLTVLLIAALGVVLSIPRIGEFMGAKSGPQQKEVVAVAGKTDAKQILPLLSAAAKDKEFRLSGSGPSALKEAVESGKYDGAVYLNSALDYTYIVKNLGMYDTTRQQVDDVLLAAYRSQTLQKLGVPAPDAQRILSVQVRSTVQKTAEGKDQMQNFFYTYVLIFVLYMAILMYGQFVASSVAAEKSTRAMELLITSAKPRSLMFGKVYGAGTAGLVQLALILGSGFLFYNANRRFYGDNEIVRSIFDMPLSILLYALLFFLLGYFIYAFLYGALGSLVSRMEDLRQAVQPVNFLFIIAFFIVMFSMGSGNVDNAAMVVCSYIPFTSPMAMFVRIAMGNVANWEIAVSVAVLIVSTIGIGFLAAAIYRMGVLLYGKAPKPREIFAMLKSCK